MADTEREKRVAAEAAAALVREGRPSGSGPAPPSPTCCRRSPRADLGLRCVATSAATEEAARALGLPVEPFDRLDRLDIAIDGADQVDPSGWLVKGGGGAHTREKIVAGAAERFVVIASSDKLVESARAAGAARAASVWRRATLRVLGPVALRDAPPSPDGGLIADHLGPIGNPAELAARLAGTPGVVEHGLFPPDLVTEVLVGRGSEVRRLVPGSGQDTSQ